MPVVVFYEISNGKSIPHKNFWCERGAAVHDCPGDAGTACGIPQRVRSISIFSVILFVGWKDGLKRHFVRVQRKYVRAGSGFFNGHFLLRASRRLVFLQQTVSKMIHLPV